MTFTILYIYLYPNKTLFDDLLCFQINGCFFIFLIYRAYLSMMHECCLLIKVLSAGIKRMHCVTPTHENNDRYHKRIKPTHENNYHCTTGFVTNAQKQWALHKREYNHA